MLNYANMVGNAPQNTMETLCIVRFCGRGAQKGIFAPKWWDLAKFSDFSDFSGKSWKSHFLRQVAPQGPHGAGGVQESWCVGNISKGTENDFYDFYVPMCIFTISH